ncbi:hypothetical protein PoB_005767200 [Plakobranchus ocellatus]|uniref:Uncharacterized protein n=1 Tax=Plakobranchus ocellatus TaxID=259542 RepID=A0AAV4CHS7_9GAST|nr:hypothetical protein PoB_005767200 [Plakobranchus ocellatus]
MGVAVALRFSSVTFPDLDRHAWGQVRLYEPRAIPVQENLDQSMRTRQLSAPYYSCTEAEDIRTGRRECMYELFAELLRLMLGVTSPFYPAAMRKRGSTHSQKLVCPENYVWMCVCIYGGIGAGARHGKLSPHAPKRGRASLALAL